MLKLPVPVQRFIAVALVSGTITYSVVQVVAAGKWLWDSGPTFCTADDNGKCFREWVSALSGWVALYVGFRTIRAMNRHQRENVEIELRDAIILAKRIRRKCKLLFGRVSNIENKIARIVVLKPEIARGVHVPIDVERQLTRLEHVLREDIFDEFEKTIYVTSDTGLALARKLLASSLAYLASRKQGNAPIPVTRSQFASINSSVAAAKRHIARLDTAASNHLKKWNIPLT